MTTKFKEFIKLHPNYIVTDINNQGLCIEQDNVYNIYYIKLQTDKHLDVDWKDYSYVPFDLYDYIVVDVSYSEDFDLFD